MWCHKTDTPESFHSFLRSAVFVQLSKKQQQQQTLGIVARDLINTFFSKLTVTAGAAGPEVLIDETGNTMAALIQ